MLILVRPQRHYIAADCDTLGSLVVLHQVIVWSQPPARERLQSPTDSEQHIRMLT